MGGMAVEQMDLMEVLSVTATDADARAALAGESFGRGTGWAGDDAPDAVSRRIRSQRGLGMQAGDIDNNRKYE